MSYSDGGCGLCFAGWTGPLYKRHMSSVAAVLHLTLHSDVLIMAALSLLSAFLWQCITASAQYSSSAVPALCITVAVLFLLSALLWQCITASAHYSGSAVPALCITGWGGPLCEGRMSSVAVVPSLRISTPSQLIQPGQWVFYKVVLEGGYKARCVPL